MSAAVRSSAPKERPTHTAPSGMGGVFWVIVLGAGKQPGHRLVRVVDNGIQWNGHEFEAREETLRPFDMAAAS